MRVDVAVLEGSSVGIVVVVKFCRMLILKTGSYLILASLALRSIGTFDFKSDFEHRRACVFRILLFVAENLAQLLLPPGSPSPRSLNDGNRIELVYIGSSM